MQSAVQGCPGTEDHVQGFADLYGQWVRVEQAAQRSCGYPIPGGDQGQVVWDPGQPDLAPDLVVGNPVQGMVGETE